MNDVRNRITGGINAYLDFLKQTKDSSDNTLQAYRRDLTKFEEFTNGINTAFYTEITVVKVFEFKKWLADTGLSASSASRSLSALRSLFQFLLSENVVKTNPAKEVHNDKAEKKGPHILTNKEIDLLLSQPDTRDLKGMRDKAMLELLYATGIKVTELISLNIEDVNFSIPFLKVGDDEKARFIPLYKIAVKSLQEYIEKSRKLLIENPEEKALFVNISGERMTRQGFWKILKFYAAEAKIKQDITPHTLRHSFAAHLLENGADIHEIQEILGHSDISSTQRYAQFLKDKVKMSYMRFHPRA
ncbi:MAG: tyrosine recombinase [Eubacteriales bacterium]|nr:tyrosine recombinase [Eubacteriales bacterium]